MTPYEQVKRIAARTGVSVEDVVNFSHEFRRLPLTPVLAYLERRIERLKGDENPAFELEQIRKDLATFVSLNVSDTLIAFRASQRKATENE